MKQTTIYRTPFIFSVGFKIGVLVLLIVSLFVLTSLGSQGILSGSLFNTPRGILVLVIIPLALLSFTGFFLYLNIAYSIQKQEHSKVSVRLFLALCFFLIASNIPVALNVGRFSAYTITSWFDRSISTSLYSALDVSRIYENERKRQLELIVNRFFNGLSIVNWISRPTDWLHEMRNTDPLVASCQVYTVDRNNLNKPEYKPLIESGDSEWFVPTNRLSEVGEGSFSLALGEDVYRIGQTVRYNGIEYLCIVSSKLPEQYRAKIRSIELAYSQALVIDTLKPHLPWVGLWIFILFCLPIQLILANICWSFSCYFGRRINALRLSTHLLLDEAKQTSCVSLENDELASIGQNLNQISSLVLKDKAQKKRTVIQL